jgi:hypothetical protein
VYSISQCGDVAAEPLALLGVDEQLMFDETTSVPVLAAREIEAVLPDPAPS